MAYFTCSIITHEQPLLHSKFLWEGSRRVGVSSSQETDLEYCVFIRPDGSVVLIILNRYVKCFFLFLCANDRKFALLDCAFVFCRSSSVIQFEVWDPSVGYIPSTAPAHSLLTLAWNTHWSLMSVPAQLFHLNHITNNLFSFQHLTVACLKLVVTKAAISFINCFVFLH